MRLNGGVGGAAIRAAVIALSLIAMQEIARADNRSRLVLDLGLGVDGKSNVVAEYPDTTGVVQIDLSIGALVSKNWELFASGSYGGGGLGSIFEPVQSNESLVAGARYWLRNRYWIKAGAGVTHVEISGHRGLLGSKIDESFTGPISTAAIGTTFGGRGAPRFNIGLHNSLSLLYVDGDTKPVYQAGVRIGVLIN